MYPSTTYYTLIGSLPALPRHFDQAERLPISRLTLLDRLKMLEPRDAQIVDEMSDFLVWERQPLERTDEDVVRHYEQFMETIDNAFERALVQHVAAVRAIIVGLRCRRLKLDPPTAVTHLAPQIARYWKHPSFQLGRQFPWISDVDAQLNGDSPFDLERKKLDISWRHAKRMAQDYQFTFEALVLYLIRWEMVYRWTQRDAVVGQQKFEQLVSDAMGPYAEMFAKSSVT